MSIASSVIVLAMAISSKDPGQIESAAHSVAIGAGLDVQGWMNEDAGDSARILAVYFL